MAVQVTTCRGGEYLAAELNAAQLVDNDIWTWTVSGDQTISECQPRYQEVADSMRIRHGWTSDVVGARMP